MIFFGYIFYWHSVVGGVVKCTGVIYGVRTSLFLTSQRMPSRYGGVHEHLQLYKRNNYIYVNVIIYVYIRTHRWLYVVITTKHKKGGTTHVTVALSNEDNLIIIFFSFIFQNIFSIFLFSNYIIRYFRCVLGNNICEGLKMMCE